MQFDFEKYDYYDGVCVHRQGIPIHSTIHVERGGEPDLRCKAGKVGCGRPLQEVRRVRPIRRPKLAIYRPKVS